MSVTKHTPGPWTIGNDKGFSATNIHAGEDAVASVFGLPLHTKLQDIDEDRFSTCLANARLIASAPDLLIALRQVVQRLELYSGPDAIFAGHHEKELLSLARAAISKAEGLPTPNTTSNQRSE